MGTTAVSLEKRTNKVNITNKQFLMFIFKTSLPLIIQNVFMQSLDFLDQVMVSSLGTKEIAAIGVCTKIVSMYFAALYGGGSGSAFFLNQYYGKDDTKNYRRMFGVNVSFCMLASICMAVLVFAFPTQIMRLFNSDPVVVGSGVRYFRVAGFAYLFCGITFPISYALKGMGYVKQTLTVTVVSIVTNVVLNYIFIFGPFGLPSFGVMGAAMGTVFSRLLEFLCYIVWIYKTRFELLKFGKDMFRLTKKRVAEYLKRVLPLIFNEIMWSAGFTVYFIIYGRRSTDALSAISIMNTMLMVSKLILGGFSGASQIALGRALGRREDELVDWYVKRFVFIALIVGIVTASLMIAISTPLLSIYGIVGTQTGVYVKQCMMVLAAYALLDSLTSINVEGFFRVAGDTNFIAFIDMGSVWIIGVTFTFVTGILLQLPVAVMFCAVVVTEIYKLPIIYHRLASKKWIHYA